jgi:hypothetical protein
MKKNALISLEKETTYRFRNVHMRDRERSKERNLVFLEYVSSAPYGRFALFRSADASWKESFTPAQLKDYVIEAVSSGSDGRGRKRHE